MGAAAEGAMSAAFASADGGKPERQTPEAQLQQYPRNTEGPPEGLAYAAHEEGPGGEKHHYWAYRVLRRGETPVALRHPNPVTECLQENELRSILLDAVAFGNDPLRTSPFLHCTSSIARARNLRRERPALYTD